MIGGFSYNDSSDTYTGTSDKTWQEIDNAFVAGVRCVVVATGTSGKHMQLTVTEIGVVAGNYYVSAGNNLDATTTSADGYPTIETT